MNSSQPSGSFLAAGEVTDTSSPVRLPTRQGQLIVKRTFLEYEEDVEADVTPKSLPRSFHSDSVVVALRLRQSSGLSDDDTDDRESCNDGEDDEEEEDWHKEAHLETVEEDQESADSEPEAPSRSETSDRQEESKEQQGTMPSYQGFTPQALPFLPFQTPNLFPLKVPSLQGPTLLTSRFRDGAGSNCADGWCSQSQLGLQPTPAALHVLPALTAAAAAAALDAAGVSRPALGKLVEQHLAIRRANQPATNVVESTGYSQATTTQLPRSFSSQPQTTVMLRNIPNNYTRNMLCSLLDKEGFKGLYDFLYLPVDFRSKAGLGYAFVNLVDAVHVPKFWKCFHGYTKWVLPSSKVCHVSWSGPHQGQRAHVERYRNSPIMHSSVPDEYKPVIFLPGSGVRTHFPPPTKKLRAPRRRS
jgi:hypothetical protein